jgi:hypothetical protein
MRAGRLRVLFITGHGFELSMLATLVARRPTMFGGDEVVIRRTGGGWFAAQDAGIRELRRLSSQVTVGAGSLDDQIQWCDVVLFSSTTAGVEAMLACRLAVYVALHDVFTADPLLGDAGVFARCVDEGELDAALARARLLTDEAYDEAVRRQAHLAERILAPLDDTVLARVLDGETEGAVAARV